MGFMNQTTLDDIERLARTAITETLHGPLPLKTSMQLATDVIAACDLARAFKNERDILLERIGNLRGALGTISRGVLINPDDRARDALKADDDDALHTPHAETNTRPQEVHA
jgi:hypothetical protein